ncbi:hypothetical protein GCM10010446_67180 [Streptomyces enissocaesilis]|uniref:Uncharacterized protein n=1 Tax=Streptomyces enissocaesilis TaxID=332589 RepID=A0ABP6K7W8_9ACTN
MSRPAGRQPRTRSSEGIRAPQEDYGRRDAMLPGMAVARATRSAPRSRSRAAGPWRTWVLTALLLTLVYSHGVSAESASGHAHLGAPTNAAAPNVPDPGSAEHSHEAPGPRPGQGHTDHQDAPEPDHAAHQCVSGQPQQGAALPVPCETPTPYRPPYAYASVAVRFVPALRASAPVPDSAVLRI